MTNYSYEKITEKYISQGKELTTTIHKIIKQFEYEWAMDIDKTTKININELL